MINNNKFQIFNRQIKTNYIIKKKFKKQLNIVIKSLKKLLVLLKKLFNKSTYSSIKEVKKIAAKTILNRQVFNKYEHLRIKLIILKKLK